MASDEILDRVASTLGRKYTEIYEIQAKLSLLPKRSEAALALVERYRTLCVEVNHMGDIAEQADAEAWPRVALAAVLWHGENPPPQQSETSKENETHINPPQNQTNGDALAFIAQEVEKARAKVEQLRLERDHTNTFDPDELLRELDFLQSKADQVQEAVNRLRSGPTDTENENQTQQKQQPSSTSVPKTNQQPSSAIVPETKPQPSSADIPITKPQADKDKQARLRRYKKEKKQRTKEAEENEKWIAKMSPEDREQHLAKLEQSKRDFLRRMGVDPDANPFSRKESAIGCAIEGSKSASEKSAGTEIAAKSAEVGSTLEYMKLRLRGEALGLQGEERPLNDRELALKRKAVQVRADELQRVADQGKKGAHPKMAVQDKKKAAAAKKADDDRKAAIEAKLMEVKKDIDARAKEADEAALKSEGKGCEMV